MNHKKVPGHRVIWSLLVVAVSGTAALAACPLMPGTAIYKPGTTPALPGPYYSTVQPSYFTAENIVAGPRVSQYKQLIPDINGSLTSTVYRDPATGFLGFKFKFTSTGASDLVRATCGGPGSPWAGVNILDAGSDCSGCSSPGTVTPVWCDGDPCYLFRDPISSGQGLCFQWRDTSTGTALRKGDTSAEIFVATDALTYVLAGVGLLDSGAVSTAQAYAPGAAAIHIEKATNDEDADTPTGPLVPVGSMVTWTYDVTNPGNVPLSNVTVTDDQGVGIVFLDGDVNHNGLLDPGETWRFEATGSALAGQYENLGSVIGTDAEGNQVSDDDPSHYFGVDAQIDIEKATNGEDADRPTGPVALVGSTVTWTYVVTNIGNVTLTNVSVTDNQGVVVTLPTSTLAPGDKVTASATGIAVAGQYGNIATATGTPPVGPDVTDSDPSHYFGADPSIDIEKATNGEDADTPQGPLVPVGDPVTWAYVVENTGNVSLANVEVTDDILGVIGTIPSLAVGESVTLTATGIAQEGQYANLATATGTPPVGPDVTDSDPSHYFGEPDEPPAVVGIDIEKATNGVDADFPTGPVVQVGSTVTWTYVVTNTGDVELTDVLVVDDILGTIGTVTSLEPGKSVTLTATGTAQAGQYANIATVTGTPPEGPDVTDSDPSHYFGAGGSDCTYTQGYWKNHEEDWPLEQLTLGGVSYTKAEAIALLRTPPKKGDATIILAHQLIAAKLNVASGASPDAVSDTIAQADVWLVANPVGSDPDKSDRAEGIILSQVLDEYNNGLIGPGHCDDNPSNPEDEELGAGAAAPKPEKSKPGK